MEKAKDSLALSTHIFWQACSACAGDYEDPDRTAPPDDGGWPDEEDGMPGHEDFQDGETMPRE